MFRSIVNVKRIGHYHLPSFFNGINNPFDLFLIQTIVYRNMNLSGIESFLVDKILPDSTENIIAVNSLMNDGSCNVFFFECTDKCFSLFYMHYEKPVSMLPVRFIFKKSDAANVR